MSKSYQKTSLQSIENSLISDSKKHQKFVENDLYFLIHGNKERTSMIPATYESEFSLSEHDLFDNSNVQTIPFQGLLPVPLEHQNRLDRYAVAHQRSVGMSNWIRQNHPDKESLLLSSALRDCGDHLIFRDYFTVGQIRLHSMCSCKKHILCPLCAIRRGAKCIDAYVKKAEVLLQENAGLRFSLITLTVKNGADLRERFKHLQSSLRKMTRHRNQAFNKTNRHNPIELNKALGAVWSYEIKIGSGSGLYHPHVHMIWAHHDDLSESALSADWLSATGDSHIVNITPFYNQNDLVSGFLEVFKYAVKFSEMPYAENFHAYQVLQGRRLVDSFGIFRGVKVPESLTDEPIESLPYVELFYRYMNGVYYLKHKHFEIGQIQELQNV